VAVTTHEVLVAARNLIAQGGWQQQYGFNAGPHCAVSAIFTVTGDRDKKAEAIEALGSILALPRISGPGVGDWNDRLGRTKEQVLALFDRAIAATAPSPDLSFLNRASFRQPEAVR
jgi:hypothetical protein